MCPTYCEDPSTTSVPYILRGSFNHQCALHTMRILPPSLCQNILFFIIRSSIRVYCSKSSTLFSNSLIIASFSFSRLFSSALSRWRSVTIACFRHYDLMIFSLFSTVSRSFMKYSSASSGTSDDILLGFPFGIVKR